MRQDACLVRIQGVDGSDELRVMRPILNSDDLAWARRALGCEGAYWQAPIAVSRYLIPAVRRWHGLIERKRT